MCVVLCTVVLCTVVLYTVVLCTVVLCTVVLCTVEGTEMLCYESEGRWFDPSWCWWIFH